jgi:hypothetical protein
MNKEVEELISTVKSWKGWRVEDRKKGYLVFPPDKAHQPIPIHRTPSGHRWKANTVAKLRRAGGPI